MSLTESRACVACGLLFTPLYKRRKARFCSRRCVLTVVGRGEYTDERYRKIGDALRGRGEGKAYRKRGGRHEHRVIAERVIERQLAPGEIVHHRDGNKLNNDPSNLVVMTRVEHMREHGLGIPGIRPKGEPWKYRRRDRCL